MGFLDLFRPKANQEPIDSLRLSGWWFSEFAGSERDRIKSLSWSDDLSDYANAKKDNLRPTGNRAVAFLGGLAASLAGDGEFDLSRRVLAKAESLAGEEHPIDLHFAYDRLIGQLYRHRDSEPGALDEAIATCEKQIALAPRVAEAIRRDSTFANFEESPPNHFGFKQLAIIRDKQGDASAAIQLCREAMQQGWDGDWENRIARYEKKLVKRKTQSASE